MLRSGYILSIALGFALGITSTARPESASVMLEKAIYAEETTGDLNAAMKLYRQIVDDAKANRPSVAEAHYRLGMCLLKKGDKAEAAAQLKQVVSQFADQKSIFAKAKKALVSEGLDVAVTPVVVRTSPRAFQNDVSPRLDKITVMFDQAMMDGSWSWTGGGETFPKTAGDIHYDKARRTCTMPVKLEPGKVYWIGINSPSHKNFKTPARVPAQRYVILFATKDANGKPTPIPEKMQTEAKAINAVTTSQPTGVVEAAGLAAERWLKLVDAGKYEESWDATAAFFQKAVSKEQWQKQLQSVRTPLGRLQSRKLLSVTFTTSLPGAPDGEYVVVQFDTNFENMKPGIETVTPMKSEDGKWQVSGYYIKPGTEQRKLSSENLSAKAWKFWQKGNYEEAEKLFKQAVEADPANSNAWQGLGWSQFNQGQPLAAKASFEKCLAEGPKNAAALNGLGWIAKGQGEDDEALGHWKKAVEALPEATAALNGLTRTLMERKEYDQAVKYYKMWLKVEPGNADAKKGLAKAESLSGK